MCQEPCYIHFEYSIISLLNKLHRGCEPHFTEVETEAQRVEYFILAMGLIGGLALSALKATLSVAAFVNLK